MRSFVTAAAAALLVLALPACGRQVTGLGETQGLVPAGKMQVVFGTEAPINTGLYSYLIVFNTSGNLNEPYALGSNSNYEDWSFVIQVGGTDPFGAQGGASAVSTPQLYQLISNPSISVGYEPYHIEDVPIGALIVNTTVGGGFTTGFSVTFNRCLLDRSDPLTGTPQANTSADCPPYEFIEANWMINLFTVDNTGTIVDSLGNNGPTDTTETLELPTATVVNAYQQKAVITQLSNAAAEIAGIEVLSQPGAPVAATPTPTPSPTPTATP
ncbi:MAG: hypothetical protein ABR975_04450 [Vulcanimicrobiaceae bacterium]